MLFHRNRWLVLLSVLLAFLPIIVDMTILHIAVPSVTLALSASGNKVLWIIDIYPLIMAGLLVPMGTLSDRIGHRRMLLAGLLIFMLASLAAAFSPTAGFLITARSLLAVGSAMVMPNVLAIIRHTFDDPKERGIALGLWGTIGSAGAALGPLGGSTARTFLVGISFPDQRAGHFGRPANRLFELAAPYANGKGKLGYRTGFGVNCRSDSHCLRREIRIQSRKRSTYHLPDVGGRTWSAYLVRSPATFQRGPHAGSFLIQQAYYLRWHFNGSGCLRCAYGCGIDVGSGTAVRGRLFSATGRSVYGTAGHRLSTGWASGWLCYSFVRTPQCCRRLTAGSGCVSRRTKRKRLPSPQYYGYHFAAGIGHSTQYRFDSVIHCHYEQCAIGQSRCGRFAGSDRL